MFSGYCFFVICLLESFRGSSLVMLVFFWYVIALCLSRFQNGLNDLNYQWFSFSPLLPPPHKDSDRMRPNLTSRILVIFYFFSFFIFSYIFFFKFSCLSFLKVPLPPTHIGLGVRVLYGGASFYGQNRETGENQAFFLQRGISYIFVTPCLTVLSIKWEPLIIERSLSTFWKLET